MEPRKRSRIIPMARRIAIQITPVNNRECIMLIRIPGNSHSQVFYKTWLPFTEKVTGPMLIVIGRPDIPLI